MRITDIRVKMLRGEGPREDKARTTPQWSLVSIVTDAGIEGTMSPNPGWVLKLDTDSMQRRKELLDFTR